MKTKARFYSLIVFIFFLQTVLVSTAFATTRIMPLGDSITEGFNSGELDPDRQVSYRKALWDKLIAAGYDVDFVGSLDSGSALFADPDHEGHNGWTDDEIVNGRPITEPDAGKLDEWLNDRRPDIVLLHIGTNDLDPDPDQVEDILNVIDAYSTDTWVILALIIKRSCLPWVQPCPGDDETTAFNDAVLFMANGRAGDKIVIVDMEDGAGIDYHREHVGDMWNDLHPFQYGIGYAKMADEWYSTLEQILLDPDPDPDPDPPNNSSGGSSGGCFIGTITE
ncbi:MAG: hypothetical protein JRJ21_07025 [Deltaproteobacteria bacterium]|nr:hypothetical protein [Deltaproteobacteria bacterium]